MVINVGAQIISGHCRQLGHMHCQLSFIDVLCYWNNLLMERPSKCVILILLRIYSLNDEGEAVFDSV